MNLTMISNNAEETRAIGAQLAGLLRANDVLLLSGDLGAGKTEFTKGVAIGLGIAEAVNSPTFNLLLVHEIPGGERPAAAALAVPVAAAAPPTESVAAAPTAAPAPAPSAVPAQPATAPTAPPILPHSLYHFDLYRLDQSEQLDDLDYFGLLEDSAVSVVEWGDRFADALPNTYILITISTMGDESRQLILEAVGAQSEQRLKDWQQLFASRNDND
ncbi:MAG: tRNA (adenosine(37)-N6)-threonylcarbamoyltransferase complex ATPase subunit type 1 TsaE [Coriobacteriia bacterium]|nr:tRNA (adenosine(37)-N6)-threonylcarbamoyltransferase complex ATPase subunit type 1 TsaE [Coriobacteriia bacterium]